MLGSPLRRLGASLRLAWLPALLAAAATPLYEMVVFGSSYTLAALVEWVPFYFFVVALPVGIALALLFGRPVASTTGQWLRALATGLGVVLLIPLSIHFVVAVLLGNPGEISISMDVAEYDAYFPFLVHEWLELLWLAPVFALAGHLTFRRLDSGRRQLDQRSFSSSNAATSAGSGT